MPTKLSQKQLIMIGAGVLALIVIGVVVVLNLRKTNTTTAVTLKVWGTEPQKIFDDLGAAYGTGRKGSQIVYTQIDPGQYEQKLLSALAAGTGPDVFEIGSHQLPQWQNVLAPLAWAPATAATFNQVTLENDFPTVVEQDFTSQGQIYALPFYIDTLAMIYNKDIFDSANIAVPPKTWDDFLTTVSQLRALNSQGQVTQAAAAIGGSQTSIPDAPDILYLLMLQNGTKMTTTDFSAATFATDGGSTSPGLAAFNFYLQFANAASPCYTWNDGLGDAESNFIQGKTAILFDYESALADIKAKAPFLNIGIAPVPQPKGATINVNYANYTGFAASKNGNYTGAWDFILYLTDNAQNEKIYTTDTGEPPALRTAIAAAVSDPALSVFASQTLSARSWYQADDVQVNAVINGAIQSVLNGSANSTQALQQAQQSVDQVMQQ